MEKLRQLRRDIRKVQAQIATNEQHGFTLVRKLNALRRRESKIVAPLIPCML